MSHLTTGATLWVVGQFISQTDAGCVWDLQGIFSTQAEAVARCRDEHYFVGPWTLGEIIPDERVDWPGSYCPLAEQDERFCYHCEDETPHRVQDDTHERDSCGDWRECLRCGWHYSGLTGDYHPPAESDE